MWCAGEKKMHDTDSVGCKRLNIEGPINGESWEEAVNQKMDDWMDWLCSLQLLPLWIQCVVSRVCVC